MSGLTLRALVRAGELFSRYGGTDTGRAVSTILQGILTNEAALQFSWKGSQGRKHAFVKLMAITNISKKYGITISFLVHVANIGTNCMLSFFSSFKQAAAYCILLRPVLAFSLIK